MLPKVANCRFAQFSGVISPFYCAMTKYLQICRYGNHFVTIFEGVANVSNYHFQGKHPIFLAFFLRALTRAENCVTFYSSKALTKDTRSQKEPQREVHLV